MIAKDVKLGKNVKIYHPELSNLYGCEIGDDTKIGAGVEIGEGVKIGKRCKISALVFIPRGVTIEDDVFIAPCVCFTNDKFPVAYGKWELKKTVVKSGSSIGANSTILPAITIGKNVMIGAGSVVTKDIPDNALAYGNPARIHRILSEALK